MLKIKDDIDLKELEKFNFEYDEDNDYWFYYGFTEPFDQSEVRYYIDNKDRRISVGFDMYVNPYKILDKAYDLIQAGLVEKEQIWKRFKVGEYLRTKEEGIILKIHNYDVGLDMYLAVDSNGYEVYVNKENIAKHSKNIIDVIEVGDIVEAELSEEFVERKDKIVLTRIGEIYTKELLQKDVNNGIIVKIKTILTKEQYNQNCFKVKGKEE